MSLSEIKHKGIVSLISPNCIEVDIISVSACVSCSAKSMCGMSEQKTKRIQVPNSAQHLLSIGDTVNVIMKLSKGYEALLWGYILPFFILMLTLIISLIYLSELYAGILSLLILVPYYIVLYINKNFLRRRFSFDIEKIAIR